MFVFRHANPPGTNQNLRERERRRRERRRVRAWLDSEKKKEERGEIEDRIENSIIVCLCSKMEVGW